MTGTRAKQLPDGNAAGRVKLTYPHTVKVGSVSIQIYATKCGGRSGPPFTAVYRKTADGPRLRVMRSDLQEILDFANATATGLANGDQGKLTLGPEAIADYSAAKESIKDSGQPLVLVCADFAEAHKLQVAALDGGPVLSQKELALFYLANRQTSNAKPLPDLVDEFLGIKKMELSVRGYQSLKSHLMVLRTKFTCPLDLVRAQDYNAFLRSLKVGPRTRKNYRGSISELESYAAENGYVRKGRDEMVRVPVPKCDALDIRILTPEQMLALLNVCEREEEAIMPFVLINGFAGVRSCEMRGKKIPLDWRDVRLAEKLIYVPKSTSKTGTARIVTMHDNLCQWLARYARPNGPVCAVKNPSNSLVRAKGKAGIPTGRNETTNILRHSCLSYWLAETQNIGLVAENAGNSPGIIKKHYRRPVPQSESTRWFGISPNSAEILQLPLLLP